MAESETKAPHTLEGVGPLLCADGLSRTDRCIGALLCSMIGDAMGASVEGHSREHAVRKVLYATGQAWDYMPAAHMGVPHLGDRKGMYTDDSQSMLALATSLAQRQKLSPPDAAQKHCQFYFHKPLVTWLPLVLGLCAGSNDGCAAALSCSP